ncbi:Diguanylate phosphodiesterase, predicted domain protein, partial [mine drainage metagenome]
MAARNSTVFSYSGCAWGLRHLAQWDLHSLSLALTLNLPPSVLVHPDCVRWIQDALAATGMAPQRLMLELLEDEETSATAMRDIAIQHLATLGVRLVMDDFGSGYSNLWRLRNLPFHSVKFDRQLLADLDTDHPQQPQFLEALLAVARSLRLRTVLGGLETRGPSG